VFWVISVYFNIRNTLSKSGTFLLGHSVYVDTHTERVAYKEVTFTEVIIAAIINVFMRCTVLALQYIA